MVLVSGLTATPSGLAPTGILSITEFLLPSITEIVFDIELVT